MILADTHVHLYPEYDLGAVLRVCVTRLHAAVPDALPVICLTERHDCHVYREMCETGKVAGCAEVRVEVFDEGLCAAIRGWRGLPPLFVLPGRQIVARERVEILCLGRDAVIADGEPAVRVVRRIQEIDGLAVLPWGVGKWMFGRRAVVAKLLETFGPGALLLGDSAMRPWFWPEPTLMRRARLAGYRVLAGTDPQPFEEQGQWIGCFATRIDAPFDTKQPYASIREALESGPLDRIGRRPGPFGIMRRMMG